MLNVLIVDDEPLALDVLETYIEKMPELNLVKRCSNALEANDALKSHGNIDLMFLDIQMPQLTGIDFVKTLTKPPMIIFTTAYPNYAIQGFDLNALDYLLKPVRTQRLLTALQKIPGGPPPDGALLAGIGREVRGTGRIHLSCHERGRLLLVPVAEVLYFKADLKYVTARTVDREYLLDEALTHLESEFAERFIRLHRAVLVAKAVLAGFEKAAGDDADAYGWALLRGVPEKLPVSRRQWAPAKALVTQS